MTDLSIKKDPRLLVGHDGCDDAGVYLLNDDTALIQTLDFFPPIVDSPYDFGQIAAANALSDVYAMGGVPLTAMNIVCFPAKDLPESILRETLEGGLEKINEAGALLVGGHSVDDAGFKYGLSVTGVVHPKSLLTNCGAQVTDRLILTKPIGTGILATAAKQENADPAIIKELIRITSTLNKKAAETVQAFFPTSCTDITGFGLAGHLLEMARASRKEFHIDTKRVPIIELALQLAEMGFSPADTYTNLMYYSDQVIIEPRISDILADIMFDPQTSGGLVYTVPQAHAEDCLAALCYNGLDARLIGEVVGDNTLGKVIFK